jgi:hypothetical protein
MGTINEYPKEKLKEKAVKDMEMKGNDLKFLLKYLVVMGTRAEALLN